MEYEAIPRFGDEAARIGVVVGGSLSKGMVVKLDSGQDVEDLAVGRYVVVRGQKHRFFCMITDVILDNTNPDIQNTPPDIADPFLKAVYIGTAAYGKINIQPMLSLENDSRGGARPMPVKTIPGHFVEVYNATVQDVEDVFGREDDHHFNVGSPLELERTAINLDLPRLVQRSIGVFGKSGTGKSFLTRLILAGVIKSDAASALIFDMHNDYGGKVMNESGRETKGLRDLFGASRVIVGSLDQESSTRRNAPLDLTVRIGYNQIEPEDLAMLRETMGFTDAMLDAAYMLRKKWGEGWLHRLMDAENDDFDEVEATTNARSGTLAGLQRRVQRFERWDFLVPETADDGVDKIMTYLRDGKSIVLEFGRYGNSLDAYILVANYITRRIHEQYVKAMERALSNKADEPRQLLIVIEEAHKFLDPRIASQTIFGTIAREMRKFNVTLLIVDQRPSGIDEEVMSQIGTRVTALLDNERDINAVLMGISGAGGLREVLARLDTQQQAIILGHAVPMPVVIKTRDYDEAFQKLLREISGAGDNGKPREPRLNRRRDDGPLR
jgi:hypothetical protein